MKTFQKLFITAVFLFSVFAVSLSIQPEQQVRAETSGNDYPIVLVHGLGGWGKGEFLGYRYWGGLKDIEFYLNQTGHRTYVATVGPVSSNWDRAVELYYYIKGGTVDYGAAHAKEHGHARFGRTYPGIYGQWDETNKIHLIGHSMGGQTSRMLVELLKSGSQKEQEYYSQHPEEGISPLFTGGKNWVHSVTSLATPHNGSTFADQEQIVSFIKDFIIHLASAAGQKQESLIYDFKLDQWGLKRQPGESFHAYMNRVMTSPIWQSNDISAYDLTTFGAQELNQWMKTYPDVYYLSYTGNASYRGVVTGNYYPIGTMHPLFTLISMQMGSYTRQSPAPVIDRSWLPNDGIVNVVSAKYPFGHPNSPYDGAIKQGVWNSFPVMEGWDHMDFINFIGSNTPGYFSIYGYYNDVANRVHSLPK
ncbi:esterase/lipase family protein [Caldibacillus thermoamylovorans]|uniref:esterase/lipase family protein n=1 Tax=Caldibacillus thermoamylovorans TaxID=35841 RepID=UPI0022E603FB|nr:lipase [Caldibacillus thermoamylovorans]